MPEFQPAESAPGEDRNLVGRVCAGDRDAAEDLFSVRLRRMIRYLAIRYSYEDLFGELYLHLMEDDCRRLRTWRAESSLDTWVQRVAINLCIERLKKERRLVLFDPEVMAEKWGMEPDMDKALLRSDLLSAIESLSSPQERLLISFHVMEDKPIEEVAKLLHINVNNAYQIKSRAIEHLRVNLSEKAEGKDA